MARIESKGVLTAALLIIGNEILSGRTRDTNAQWIGEKLNERGIMLVEVRIIPDHEEVIVGAVKELREKVDYLFTTGGIGPTHDDITSSCIARAFGVNLELNEEAHKVLEEHYGADGLTRSRLKMAMVPEGCRLIGNPVTAAPGFCIGNVYAMAGVPRIMQAMFEEILGLLWEGMPIISNTIACSLGEGDLADDLGEMQNRYPDIEIGSYPHYRGGVPGLSIVLRSTENDKLDAATQELIGIIRRLGDEPRAISVRSDMGD